MAYYEKRDVLDYIIQKVEKYAQQYITNPAIWDFTKLYALSCN